MLFYTLLNSQGRISFSPAPEVDRLFSGTVKYLDLGLPLETLRRYLPLSVCSEEAYKNEAYKPEQIVKSRILQGLRKDGSMLVPELEWQEKADCLTGEYSAGRISRYKEYQVLQDEIIFTRFCALTAGRQIAEGELPFLAQALSLSEKELIWLMQKAVILKKGQWAAALWRERSGWRCERCGSTGYEEWPSLYGPAATCLSCKSIGSLSSLQVLFSLKHQGTGFNPKTEADLAFGQAAEGLESGGEYLFKFTPAQKQAAEKLLTYDAGGGPKEALVWAACGAGKTEVCFPIISSCLREGKKILFAAPRQDVVHDVGLRLQRNFPDLRLNVLSGAMPPDWGDYQLTVATTHQVLRFKRAFERIIFDEMDAYPYAHSKVLEYGLKHSLQEEGRVIYLTATPSEEILQKVKLGQCSLIRLPARHHGHPLPVPEIKKIKLPAGNQVQAGQILRDNSLPSLRALVTEMVDQGPLLVFVPAISMVREWVKVFKTLLPSKRVEGSWSSDSERGKKVAAFLNGRNEVFVCTSILERGITVSGVQVVVLYAQHELFDVRTLVQMAGRTGRTSQCPSGRAVFIASQATKAMLAAQDWIYEQNVMAEKGGFLHV